MDKNDSTLSLSNPFQHCTALITAFTCTPINITRKHVLKDVFAIGSKASHGVSNDSKKNLFLIVSYFLGPNERSFSLKF